MKLLNVFKKRKGNSLEEENVYNRSKERQKKINIDSKLFEFLVQDVFFVMGKGLVVTGKVSLGSMHVNDRVYLEKSDGEIKEVIINGIETYHQIQECADVGESVGVMLKNVKKKEVLKGTRLYR